jgi:hypothetical protein
MDSKIEMDYQASWIRLYEIVDSGGLSEVKGSRSEGIITFFPPDIDCLRSLEHVPRGSMAWCGCRRDELWEVLLP